MQILKLTLSSLALLLLLSRAILSEAKTKRKVLVRGVRTPSKLTHFSMHARQLKEDDEEEVVDALEEVTEPPKGADNNKNDKDDKAEDEVTPDPVAFAETEPPVDDLGDEVIDDAMGFPNTTMPSTENMIMNDTAPDGEVYTVPLEPFSLTVDGAEIDEEEADLDQYLLSYMSDSLPNCDAVDLTVQTVMDEAETPTNITRRLRIQTRALVVQTFYYQGNVTCVGPEQYSVEDVDAALTQALEDTAALQAHLQNSAPAANVTVTEVTPGDPIPDEGTTDASQEEATSPPDGRGLNSVGLSIVIVAAVIGGLSLLIILFVGVSGPSGPASDVKEGLPEQAL